MKDDRESQSVGLSHLEPAELKRFLRGELGKAETRRVVRHLLTSCPVCVAVARPMWEGGRL